MNDFTASDELKDLVRERWKYECMRNTVHGNIRWMRTRRTRKYANPTDMNDLKLERITELTPAWDRTDPDPNKSYGIHSVELRMVLKGPLGATQFVLYTNWHLPEVSTRLLQRPIEVIGSDPHWSVRPQPADVGYHSPTPRYEGQPCTQEECEYLDGKPCYYDGSGLAAEDMYVVLLREGSEGVWRELEEQYKELFTQAEPT